MRKKAYLVHAFTRAKTGGNPAGVVLEADGFLESQMQEIARKIGFSETAFVCKSDAADYKVRFFTPNEEVELCGHATIATFHTLATQGFLCAGTYTQETLAGNLKVEVKEDYSIRMSQNNPQFYAEVSKQEIADSLHISVSDILTDLPAEIVSTGLKDIIIPIKNLSTLQAIRPDFDKIAAVSKKYDCIGYHLFTPETSQEGQIYTRNFAPLYGINEESATGTSSGALACYLYQHGKVSAEKAKHITFMQGDVMNRPSMIFAELEVAETKITSVKVGGEAVLFDEVCLEDFVGGLEKGL